MICINYGITNKLCYKQFFNLYGFNDVDCDFSYTLLNP